MHYTYILFSPKSHKFYFGSTNDLKARFALHNTGKVRSTKFGLPWRLIWYGGFSTEKEARDFENYLKSGSGKSFAYKRLISVALERIFYQVVEVVRSLRRGYQARQHRIFRKMHPIGLIQSGAVAILSE